MLEELSAAHLAAAYDNCGWVRRGSEGDKKANRGLVTSDCNALDMAEESEGF